MDDSNIMRFGAEDTVFTHLFSEKRYVLKLFQALYPEASNVTEDMIEIITRRKVLVNDNDLVFTVGNRLIIVTEAQKDLSVNIIIRALLYVAAVYQDIVETQKLNIYRRKKISLPRPELYIISTGRRKDARRLMSLSEEFFGGRPCDIDVKVHVLTDIKCGDIIDQYITFMREFNKQVREYGKTEFAVDETILICKDRGILEEYLTKHEQEVHDIMITLFNDSQIQEAYAKELREEGQAQGRALERDEMAKRMLINGYSSYEVARICGLPRDRQMWLERQIAN